ncbi:MAG: hypothetical protein FWE80_05530, partial [Oscillospiraceae bacterium]|nr:hypothetical protein [Oscillospiraceae bacterium]
EDLDDEPDDEMTDTSTAASATKDPVTKESTAAPTTKDPTTKAPTAAPTTKAPVTAAPTAAPANKTNWKQFLQEYEAWIDSYLVILKKYRDNPADLSILSDYMEAMQKLTEWAEKVDKIESELADSPEALAEYLAAISRILGKISQFE